MSIKHLNTLSETDLNQISNLWLKSNITSHSFVEPSYWKNNLGNVRQAIKHSDIWVKFEHNRIIGFMGIVDGYIAGIFINSDCQRRGVGSGLINQAKETYDKLTLRVFLKNQNAVNFYQKNGFTIIEKTIDEATSQPEYLMLWAKNKKH